jgi:carbonic anhydrase/acetyltransferase-like protein (isoleucine patch superfamily)
VYPDGNRHYQTAVQFGSASTISDRMPVEHRIRIWGLTKADGIEYRWEEFVVDACTCRQWTIIGANSIVMEHDELLGTRLMLYDLVMVDEGAKLR